MVCLYTNNSVILYQCKLQLDACRDRRVAINERTSQNEFRCVFTASGWGCIPTIRLVFDSSMHTRLKSNFCTPNKSSVDCYYTNAVSDAALRSVFSLSKYSFGKPNFNTKN